MSEDTQTKPTHQRIIEAVFTSSLTKTLGDEQRFSQGHTTITLSADNELKEYTPEDFNPSNDLEDFLFQNKQASSLSQTIDFAVQRFQLYKALSTCNVILEDRYNCELMVMCTQPQHQGDNFAVRLELTSKKLNRTLYLDITSHIGN